MGYTTKFYGRFKLDKPLMHKHVGELRDFCEETHHEDDPAGCPGGHCQWIASDDRAGIEWDQSEKFYDYTAWLRFVIDHFLKPWGYTLCGEVVWQGEETGDVGVLRVVANAVDEHKGVTSLEPPKKGDERLALKACMAVLVDVCDDYDGEDIAERAAVALRQARAAIGERAPRTR